MVATWCGLPGPADGLAVGSACRGCRWCRYLVGSSELRDGFELEASLRRVVYEVRGALARHPRLVDEVREVRARTQGERVQQLVIHADHRHLLCLAPEAEVTPREGGDDGVLLQVFV